MTNQHIKKQTHCFVDKGPYRKTMVFPVVMYGCMNIEMGCRALLQGTFTRKAWGWQLLLGSETKGQTTGHLLHAPALSQHVVAPVF